MIVGSITYGELGVVLVANMITLLVIIVDLVWLSLQLIGKDNE